METGRGSSDKGGDGQDALIFRQQLIETIAHGGGTVQRGSLREIDLDGELIPVGYRHHALAQLSVVTSPVSRSMVGMLLKELSALNKKIIQWVLLPVLRNNSGKRFH